MIGKIVRTPGEWRMWVAKMQGHDGEFAPETPTVFPIMLYWATVGGIVVYLALNIVDVKGLVDCLGRKG